MNVRYSTFDSGGLPLVLTPTAAETDPVSGLCDWLESERKVVDDRLLGHGAILLRGFGIDTPEAMARVVDAFGGEALDYVGGVVPRTRLAGNVFNSTELNPLFRIQIHNELAYQPQYPDTIFFACRSPSPVGGRTPLADTRRIYRNLDPALIEEFDRRQVRYVRVLQKRIASRERAKKFNPFYVHLTWDEAFGKSDPADVEDECERLGMDYRWRADGDLELHNVLPATIRHPISGEPLWFNHVNNQHFNRRALGWHVYAARRLLYPRNEDAPNHVYFGDGSEIGGAALAQIYRAIARNTVSFPWERGDCLVVDNRLVGHGRTPYVGHRSVMVSMLTERGVSRHTASIPTTEASTP